MFVGDNGSVTSGLEANMAKEFANKYKLKMKWFNANYVWGAFDKNLQRLFLNFIISFCTPLLQMEWCCWSYIVWRC